MPTISFTSYPFALFQLHDKSAFYGGQLYLNIDCYVIKLLILIITLKANFLSSKLNFNQKMHSYYDSKKSSI